MDRNDIHIRCPAGHGPAGKTAISKDLAVHKAGKVYKEKMRFTNGFIMLPRGLRDEYFYGDTVGHDLLIYILSNAHWDESKPGVYGKGRYVYEVRSGEFISTLGNISGWLGVSRGVLTRTLSKLIRLKLVEEKKLYNCSKFIINSDLAKTIRKPDENQTESKRTTNEQRTKNKEINRVSKDTLVHDAQKITTDLELGNQPKPIGNEISRSDIPENRKNTPPVDEDANGSMFTPNDLFELWNSLSGVLPKCRVLSDKRKRQCKLRLKENRDETYWRTVIENLAKSTFAIEGNWASFDWIVKNSENSDKAFNGNYNDKKAKKWKGMSDYGQNYDDIPY